MTQCNCTLSSFSFFVYLRYIRKRYHNWIRNQLMSEEFTLCANDAFIFLVCMNPSSKCQTCRSTRYSLNFFVLPNLSYITYLAYIPSFFIGRMIPPKEIIEEGKKSKVREGRDKRRETKGCLMHLQWPLSVASCYCLFSCF